MIFFSFSTRSFVLFTDSPISNDQYYNVDSYAITDNNKFQAEQYENIWTLKD